MKPKKQYKMKHHKKKKCKMMKYDKEEVKEYPKKVLSKGTKVEMEHTKNKKVATKIALDHLEENPKYYDKVKLKKGYVEQLVSIKKKKSSKKDD